ncbi:hypothetical protein GCM10011608_37240 [Micromonospora sonchi]|uniref:Uncharacterized protein n=1 Tax=Micromonospora sonchi TaxID=1763543 RepID=A0A917U054_9ACTN|nr:hypothetical protein GCM10011608_37240 [Micromonospora sonchi]
MEIEEGFEDVSFVRHPVDHRAERLIDRDLRHVREDRRAEPATLPRYIRCATAAGAAGWAHGING